MSFIVAIDGLTSSGKSTISNLIAKEMGFVYVQTGAMYRCVALELLKNSIQLNEQERIRKILDSIEITFDRQNSSQIVRINGEDVTQQIRTKEVTDYTSEVAFIGDVRHKLLEEQRKIVQNSDIVIEGRDTGTNVFPNADVKFYLTAKPIIRPKRKQRELEMLGEKLELMDVLASMYEWDKDAIRRKEGALRHAKDSIYIDSSEMEVEELKGKMIGILKKDMKKKIIVNNQGG